MTRETRTYSGAHVLTAAAGVVISLLPGSGAPEATEPQLAKIRGMFPSR